MPRSLRLASVVDWAGFSRAVRALRAEGVAPDGVRWRIAGRSTAADLFDAAEARAGRRPAVRRALPLPRPSSTRRARSSCTPTPRGCR